MEVLALKQWLEGFLFFGKAEMRGYFPKTVRIRNDKDGESVIGKDGNTQRRQMA